MKTSSNTALLLLFFLLCSVSFSGLKAQEEVRRNFIQLTPLGILFGNIDLQYERGFGKAFSGSIAISPKVSGGIIRVRGLDSPTVITTDFEFTGFHITPEFRYYILQTDQRYTGLYTGVYYRFKKAKDDIVGVYNSETTGTSSPIDVDVDFFSHTFGVELGYKLPIGKRWFIDFLVAGPGYSVGDFDITENQPLPPEFYDDIAAAIVDNYQALADWLRERNFDFEQRDKDAVGNFRLPAFRYAVKLSFSF